MDVYSFIKVIPGFWIMPTELWHCSSLSHIQAKFPFSKVSAACTNTERIGGSSACKTHSRVLYHVGKPYDIKSNSILFHQLWLLEQLTYWVSLQQKILTPWNDTNPKNICSEIQPNLPCSLGHTSSQWWKFLRTEIFPVEFLWNEFNFAEAYRKFLHKSSILNAVDCMPSRKLRIHVLFPQPQGFCRYHSNQMLKVGVKW